MGVGNIATSGLKSALTNMEAISNNIANVNTLGYKKSFVNFADIYMGNISGGNNQVGFGTRIHSVQQDFSSGRIESSTRGLDLRLANDGFFVQKNSATGLTTYTRAGRLDFDKDGNLTGLGGVIQGYPANNGQIIAAGNLVDLKISNAAIPAKPTQNVNISLNISSEAEVINTPFSATNPESYNYRSDETIFDSLGNSYLMSLYYIKSSDNNWTTEVAVNDNIIGSGNMVFSDTGNLMSTTGMTGLSWNPTGGAVTPQNLDINLTGSTQFAGDSKSYDRKQDGCPSGMPLGCSIDTDGILNVYYSNGMSRIEGQIAVAQFRAPQGLSKADNMSWMATSDSGEPLINLDSSRNNIINNSVEYSNVELTEELVKLIDAQHNFQANAQVQQTYNQVMQTIENL